MANGLSDATLKASVSSRIIIIIIMLILILIIIMVIIIIVVVTKNNYNFFLKRTWKTLFKIGPNDLENRVVLTSRHRKHGGDKHLMT